MADRQASGSSSGPPPSAASGSAPSSAASNVHFDQTTGKWQYEDLSTGIEYEYDDQTSTWRRIIDEDELKQQQDAYAVSGVDEEQPAAPVERRMNKKKRKAEQEGTTDPNSLSGEPTSSTLPVNEAGVVREQKIARGNGKAGSPSGSGAASGGASSRPRINSSLFISSLPLDATAEEIASVFSRYGIISEDDAGNPRIKLYTDPASGDMFKGEALVTFFKPESCELAIQLLDGTCLRAAEGQSKPLMKVEMADWSKASGGQQSNAVGAKKGAEGSTGSAKEKTNDAASSSSASATASSSADPGKASASSSNVKRPPPRTEADKKRAAKRYARMADKLSGWDSASDDEESASLRSSGIRAGYAHPTSRLVILKRIFTLSELEEDPSLLLDLKGDVREECEAIGAVTSVTLYDEEPEGVVTVKFKRVEDARECVKRMDGRFFAQRRLEAFLAEGNKVRFRRSGRGGASDAEDDDEVEDGEGKGKDDEGKRRDGFGDWLEAGGDD
ncbi:hypothetical protein BDZ90DRAFT_232919 [Jaminaea rosea]|uniref:RRM domain-containing protein n=1 Tax=Jaminaea rosea TaxID=1569628 RepID=A0A316UR79_9BASI|nr:hypothetical protein BDZ90DRAFT_232919 [Jaminaea rosea]PWN26821.1 hypothetical protein BDZ90DRAFT_232919 [Jaminaea rosea]